MRGKMVWHIVDGSHGSFNIFVTDEVLGTNGFRWNGNIFPVLTEGSSRAPHLGATRALVGELQSTFGVSNADCRSFVALHQPVAGNSVRVVDALALSQFHVSFGFRSSEFPCFASCKLCEAVTVKDDSIQEVN